MRRGERSVAQLPIPLLIGFAAILMAQITFHHVTYDQSRIEYKPLREPLEVSIYRDLAMNSRALMGSLLSIRLQVHDNQAGQHFRYERIDYALLVRWLDTIAGIYPANEYPMLLASRVYSSSRDPEQLRILLEYIEQGFERDPQLFWRRMTEATLIAKHQLDDLELALRLAQKVADLPESVKMPVWARDFKFLLLAELNEFESAIAEIQLLLESDAVNDPDERRFLLEKLSDFQQKLLEFQQSERSGQ